MNLSDLIWYIYLALGLLYIAVEYTGFFLIRYAKKYRWAVIFYTYKIKLTRRLSSDYVNRSWAYLCLKEYERAIQDCHKALALKPEAPMAYNNRGAAYLWLKQYSEALHDFSRAIELKPDLVLAYKNRGTVYLRMKDYQRALPDFHRALASNPKDAGLYFNRGVVFIKLKEYQRALQDFEQALVFNPASCGCYHNRGLMYLHLHSLERGRADILKAWELHPTSMVHGWMVEFCRLCVEKPDLATAERLEKLTSLDPNHVTVSLAYLCQGVALWLRERYEEALIELEQMLLEDPDSQDAYFWVGMTCASLGRDEEAKQALNHALELGLPRVLLAPLWLLQEKQPAFFEKCAKPLLQ